MAAGSWNEYTFFIDKPSCRLPRIQKDRIATFDQDGTLWVEHPLYSQYLYILSKTNELVSKNPSYADQEPFKTVLSGDMKKISVLSTAEIFRIAVLAQDGLSVEEYQADVEKWLATARDPRWGGPIPT